MTTKRRAFQSAHLQQQAPSALHHPRARSPARPARSARRRPRARSRRCSVSRRRRPARFPARRRPLDPPHRQRRARTRSNGGARASASASDTSINASRTDAPPFRTRPPSSIHGPRAHRVHESVGSLSTAARRPNRGAARSAATAARDHRGLSSHRALLWREARRLDGTPRDAAARCAHADGRRAARPRANDKTIAARETSVRVPPSTRPARSSPMMVRSRDRPRSRAASEPQRRQDRPRRPRVRRRAILRQAAHARASALSTAHRSLFACGPARGRHLAVTASHVDASAEVPGAGRRLSARPLLRLLARP